MTDVDTICLEDTILYKSGSQLGGQGPLGGPRKGPFTTRTIIITIMIKV